MTIYILLGLPYLAFALTILFCVCLGALRERDCPRRTCRCGECRPVRPIRLIRLNPRLLKPLSPM